MGLSYIKPFIEVTSDIINFVVCFDFLHFLVTRR